MAPASVQIEGASVCSDVPSRQQNTQKEKRKDVDSPLKPGGRNKQLDTRGSGRKKKFFNNLDAHIDVEYDFVKGSRTKAVERLGTSVVMHAIAADVVQPRKPTTILNSSSSRPASQHVEEIIIEYLPSVTRPVTQNLVPLEESCAMLTSAPFSFGIDRYISVSSSPSECSEPDGFDVPPRSVEIVSEGFKLNVSDSSFASLAAGSSRLQPVPQESMEEQNNNESLIAQKSVRSQSSSPMIVDREVLEPEPYDPFEDRTNDMIWYADADNDAGSSEAGDITLVADPTFSHVASTDSSSLDGFSYSVFDAGSSAPKRMSASKAFTVDDLLCTDSDSYSAGDADSSVNAELFSSPSIASVQESSGRTRRPASSSDRLLVQLEREQEKQRRAADRDVRQQHAHAAAVDRLTNKARQNAYNQLNKWKKTQVAEHTVPVIDTRLFEQFGRKEIAVLKEYCTSCRAADNRVPYSVLFMQQNMQFDVVGDQSEEEESRTGSPARRQRRLVSATSSTEERELDEVLLQLPLDDFIHLVYNDHHNIPDIRNQTDQLPLTGSRNAAPRTPVAYYRWLKARMPRKRITLFVCGLESYFRQMSNSGGGTSRRRPAIDTTSSALSISPTMVEATLATLQCFCHVTLHFVEDSDDLAKFVGRMTRALEKRPLLVAKQHLYSHCMGTGAAQARIVVRSCDVRTDDALPKLWAQQLAQFPAATASHAAVVCMRYGGGLPYLLLEYYRNQRRLLLQSEAEMHLADAIVQERVRKNGVVMRRRFGAELSRQLYRFYCVDAPDELLKVAVDDDEPSVVLSVRASETQETRENGLVIQNVLENPGHDVERFSQTRQQNAITTSNGAGRRRAERGPPGGTVATLRALAKDFHLDIDDEAFSNLERNDENQQPDARGGRSAGAAPKRNFYYGGRGSVNGWRGRAAFFRGRGSRRGN